MGWCCPLRTGTSGSSFDSSRLWSGFASLDVAEVRDHRLVVEGLRRDDDLHPAVVAVQVGALALVADEAMAVAEIEDLGDGVHETADYFTGGRPPSSARALPTREEVGSRRNPSRVTQRQPSGTAPS